MSHSHPQGLVHHFDDLGQQKEAATLGMWGFLVTEVLFFGGLITSYIVLRALYPEVFLYGSHQLDWKLGGLNTLVLLVSSLTMAFAVHAAHEGKQQTTFRYLIASMGEFLLAAGTKGKRYALPHARIMMHQPSAGIGGTAADIAIQAQLFRNTKVEMNRLNAQFTGQTIEKIEADADRDKWFTAEEARDYGFVDHVVSRASSVK